MIGEDLNNKFSSLIAEASGLAPGAIAHFFDTPQQHRLRISQYPVIQGSSDHGLGPHFDAGFLTFVRFLSEIDPMKVKLLHTVYFHLRELLPDIHWRFTRISDWIFGLQTRYLHVSIPYYPLDDIFTPHTFKSPEILKLREEEGRIPPAPTDCEFIKKNQGSNLMIKHNEQL